MRISDWSSDVCSSDLRSSPMTDVAAGRYAGTRVHRVEDARLLTGRGTFVDDVDRPGMLHACFVRSPFARARIGEIDASEALALPGVHAVRSEEHTSELQSLMRISYAVFCLKNKSRQHRQTKQHKTKQSTKQR